MRFINDIEMKREGESALMSALTSIHVLRSEEKSLRSTRLFRQDGNEEQKNEVSLLSKGQPGERRGTTKKKDREKKQRSEENMKIYLYLLCL